MTAMAVILICAGVLVLLVLICAVCLWWNRSGENKAYDERQLVEQGRARAVADTVSLIYFIFLMVMLSAEDPWLTQYIPVYLLILIGVEIQVLTYHIYCVMTHALLPFGTTPYTTLLVSVTWSVILFGNYYVKHRGEALISGGEGSIGLLCLVLGMTFAFYALIHLIALLRKERE